MPHREDAAAQGAEVTSPRAPDRHVRHRRRLLLSAGVLAGAVLVAGVGTFAIRAATAEGAPARLPTPPVASGATLPPWALPADPAAAIRAAGLSASSMEGGAHFHPHLDVIVDGATVPVAANIGVDPAAGTMSELHTHDQSGLIHIESPSTNGRYVLGQLFTQWGVRLDEKHLGGLQVGKGKSLTAFVDGKPVPTNPAQVELLPHRQITLVFGPSDQKAHVPSSYSFPPGT